jgi:hypothetical protein
MSERSGSGLIVFRIFMISAGLLGVTMGWLAQSQGIYWHARINERIGQVGFMPTADWVALGFVALLTGIFPWKWLSDRFKR